MVSFPPCKINLGLHILRKRTDGYHDIETCFYPVPWTDILEIIPAQTLTFTSSGHTIPGAADDNLCLQAFRLLQQDHAIPPVHIHLHKVIPMGAGLGGGSADAAYTLRMLNDMFALNLSMTALMNLAARLGSDCAFFIQDHAMLGTGRGEVLSPLAVSLKGKYIVLVKPDIHVSTAEAYAGVTPDLPARAVEQVVMAPLDTWRTFLYNDFEQSVLVRYPAIAAIKQQLYDAGAVYAAMSGSGSTVFGIFDQEITWPASNHITWRGWLS